MRLTCALCESPFHGRANALYCSSGCRKRVEYLRKRSRELQARQVFEARELALAELGDKPVNAVTQHQHRLQLIEQELAEIDTILPNFLPTTATTAAE